MVSQHAECKIEGDGIGAIRYLAPDGASATLPTGLSHWTRTAIDCRTSALNLCFLSRPTPEPLEVFASCPSPRVVIAVLATPLIPDPPRQAAPRPGPGRWSMVPSFERDPGRSESRRRHAGHGSTYLGDGERGCSVEQDVVVHVIPPGPTRRAGSNALLEAAVRFADPPEEVHAHGHGS